MRRVTRLEPPYVASTILAILMVALYQHGLPPGFGVHSLASIFYQHNLIYGQASIVNGVAWSLEVEIQFYILAPLAMQFYRIRRTFLRRALLFLSILCISLTQTPFQTWPRFELSILFFLQYFLMGLLVADIFVLNLEKMKFSWIWDIAGVASLGAIFLVGTSYILPHALMPIPMGVLCIAAMRGHLLNRIFGNQWVAVIGGMCYSIYLLHFLFIAMVFKLTRHAILPGKLFLVNYSVQLLLTVVPTVVLCALFFLLIERPCMDPNWPSKLWHRLTGRRESEVAVLDAGGISEG
jgi:peptidoglycan/LPS O-acetylase OafA/YrhL